MSAIIFDESFILRFDTHLTNTEVLTWQFLMQISAM